MSAGASTLRLLLKPIAEWLESPDVTEVCIQRPGLVWVETRSGWKSYRQPVLCHDYLMAIATLAAAQSRQDIGPDRPLCATTLPDGQRIQVCVPPAVPANTVSLTIRRPASFMPELGKLAETGLFERCCGAELGHETAMAEFHRCGDGQKFLECAVLCRKNIVISGATGSGKTTLAWALINLIPGHERLVTIEDTAEWNGIPHENRVALFYSKGGQGAAKVTSEELLEASLRMRPDRVLMQELRDGAAFTYLRGVAAGHPGSITTCHAGSAAGTFDALRLMVRQHPAGRTLDDRDVRDLLRQMIDVVVHCRRDGNQFRITEIWWKEAENVPAA